MKVSRASSGASCTTDSGQALVAVALLSVILCAYPPFFMQRLGFGMMMAPARAEGLVVSTGFVCVHALHPTSQAALHLIGGATITANDCGVVVNSDDDKALKLDGRACITAASIDVTGGVHGNCASPAPTTGVPPLPDPLAGVPLPTFSGCDFTNFEFSGPSSIFLSPGVYCGGITIGGGNTTFLPGLYVLNGGGFSVSSAAVVNGTGVTFFNTEHAGSIYGSFDFRRQTRGKLSAPISGPWAGILMIQDPRINSPEDSSFAGGSDMVLEGILYMPGSKITWSGGSNTASYSSLIASEIKFTGSSTFNSDWSAFSAGRRLF